MKISKVLRKARKIFDSWESDMSFPHFVCDAVDMVRAESGDLRKTQDYIRSLIYPYATVSEWLQNEGGVKKYDYGMSYIVFLKDYRIRWIDHMIYELEKEGK